MIDYDQILKDTTAIVKSLVSGALGNGCNPNIANLVNETYEALKAVAERAEQEYGNDMQSKATEEDTDF